MPSGFQNWSQTAGTNATADSSVNWAEGQAPSSVNDSARAMMAVLAKWRDDNNGSLTTAGSSTAYTLTTNTVFTTLALMDNQTLGFTIDETSGAAPTLNVDGLGAKTIRTATGVELVAGALVAGGFYTAHYNNTAGIWYLNSPLGALGPTTMGSTLTVVGAATLSSTLAVTGNVTVNTNKFTVTAASGNTLIAGVLDVTGNFSVNTGKFTVIAASGDTSVAGTLAVTGATTLTGAATGSSSILSASATAGIGYATGAGGTVTQLTSKSTGVTLNKICGSITMNNATLNAGAQVQFTLTNSAIGPADVLVLNHISAGTLGVYLLTASCLSGTALINVRNTTAASNLSEAIVLQFAVIKAVTS